MSAALQLRTRSDEFELDGRRAHAERSNAVEWSKDSIPDHVPEAFAVEHADAASVVGRTRRGKTVRVVRRGDDPRTALPALALLACVTIAALAAGSSPAPASTARTTRGDAVAASGTSDADPACEAGPVAKVLFAGCGAAEGERP